MSESKITDEFYVAFTSHCSHCRTECACGKIFFDYHNSYDWEPGERGELDGLVVAGLAVALDHAVGTIELGGVFIVPECDCAYSKRAQLFQNFLVKHPAESMRFIHGRIMERLENIMPLAIEAGILSEGLKSEAQLRDEVAARQKAMQKALVGTP